MNANIRLYDGADADRIPWPDTEEGRYARAWLLPFMREGADRYIDNVQTRVMALAIDDLVLPVTVNDGEYDNSYVVSPYTHYVSYAAEELKELRSPRLERGLAAILQGIGSLLRIGRINRAVIVNNWMLSTNLYPELKREQAERITAFLADRFPHHAILFRSVNPHDHPELYRALGDGGYRMAASRQVYLLDAGETGAQNSKARWLIKRDERLIASQGYEIVRHEELTMADIPRITALYQALYLDKYSRYNPQFNERFFALALRERTLCLIALRKEGRLDAVLGYFSRSGVMTTPVFGYDTSLPRETGLYRMLSAVLIREAQRLGMWLNESSGAAEFKRNRGAVGHFEYTAAYTRHLPPWRRGCWLVLAGLANRVGMPLMRKFKL